MTTREVAGTARLGKWRHLGLTFEAPFPLGSPADQSLPTDVVVKMGRVKPVGTGSPGPVVAELTLGGRQFYTVYRVGSSYLFRFADSCEFWVTSDGGEVTCEPAPSFDEGIVAVLVVGTVTALVLTLRGLAVVHGSAVQWQGLNVVFAGSSGRGKTTMAALCCAAGANFITDDLVALEPLGGDVFSVGLASELRLRESAREIAGLFPSPLTSRQTADGRMALRPPPADAERLAVSAVVLPQPSRDSQALALRPVAASDAVTAILANSRVPAMAPVDWQRRYFEVAADLASNVPVVVATVPWGPPFTTASSADLFAELLRMPRHEAGNGAAGG